MEFVTCKDAILLSRSTLPEASSIKGCSVLIPKPLTLIFVLIPLSSVTTDVLA